MRLIDADALKKVFHVEWDDVLVWDESGETTADEFCNLVDDAPTIEAEPVKRGKWEPVTNGRGGFECSICHSYAPSYQDGVEWLSLYCPNCGVKMENGA